MSLTTETVTPQMAQVLESLLGDPPRRNLLGMWDSLRLEGGTVSLESDGSIRIKVKDEFMDITITREDTIFPEGGLKTRNRQCYPRDPLPPGVILQVGVDGINYPWQKPDCTTQTQWAFIDPEKVMVLKGAIFGFQGTCPTEAIKAQAESLRQAMGL